MLRGADGGRMTARDNTGGKVDEARREDFPGREGLKGLGLTGKGRFLLGAYAQGRCMPHTTMVPSSRGFRYYLRVLQRMPLIHLRESF